ncbi:MAG TPA: AMP-binding protein, partial [Bacteroidia bacterium]|nr:AMP-binding protein [Bacteroidia bacterium]
MKYDFGQKQFVETALNADKLAVAGSDGDLSWAMLKQQTEELCEVLKKLQIPQGHPVLIYGHKEKFFPVAMLACIQCSLPYVPADRMYPPERIRKIIEITGSQVLIQCGEVVPDVQIPVVIGVQGTYQQHTMPLFEGNTYGDPSDPLQYILFTSGSTGEPKGVQITRDAVQAFINWVVKDYGFRSDDVFLNQAPFTFDISLYDLLGAFAMGASLVLNSADICKNQDLFLKRIRDYRCSIWNSTPSFVFLYLRNALFLAASLPALRTFILIGEEFPNRTARLLRTGFPGARLYNAYGPTEATVATSLLEITDTIIEKYPSLPIGYAMPGSELFIEKNDP